MKRLILLFLAALVLFTACSSAALDNAGKEINDEIANATDADNKYVKMVKGGYRVSDPSVTYETAFNAFFGSPRWKYFKGEDGQDVVEFTGDCVYQDVPVKARIQFIVDEENETFEAAYLAFNEVPQTLIMLTAIISKAFEQVSPTEPESSADEPDIPQDQLLFDGIPVENIFEMPEDEVVETFGEPQFHFVKASIVYGQDTPEWIDFHIDDDGIVESISSDIERFTYNGQSLFQEKDAVSELLGDAYTCESLGGIGDGFEYEWSNDSIYITLTFPKFADDDGRFMPYYISVQKKVTDWGDEVWD